MIRLYNSKTRRKEDFAPLDPGNVRMYVCGPTVYDRAHLGNARPAIVFDVLYRLLRHEYGPDHVTYVRNFTDVDDKINARAAETGRPIGDITEETTRWYLDDMAAIGVMEPTHMPRATAYIPHMIRMIEALLHKGFAYPKPISYGHNSKAIYFHSSKAPEHAFFEVGKFDRYGKLSGRTLGEMISGARSEVGEGKKSPMDFVLWKPSTVDEPGWESPWGFGRPGWHIECSAMAKALLGETFDIHGGGNDLMFPHHENEIAQSCCANGTEEMARVWMHNEMLQVEGKKMSKSLGNFFTVRDLLDQGVPGEVIRFVMLSTHYRKPMDWTKKKRDEASACLRRWLDITVDLEPSSASDHVLDDRLVDALADDLNTHLALTYINALQSNPQKLLDHARFLGFLADEQREQHRAVFEVSSFGSGTSPELAALGDKLDGLRRDAMQTKDFSEVDRLKAALVDAGVEVRMSKTRVELVPGAGFDPSKLGALSDD